MFNRISSFFLKSLTNSPFPLRTKWQDISSNFKNSFNAEDLYENSPILVMMKLNISVYSLNSKDNRTSCKYKEELFSSSGLLSSKDKVCLPLSSSITFFLLPFLESKIVFTFYFRNCICYELNISDDNCRFIITYLQRHKKICFDYCCDKYESLKHNIEYYK